MESDAGLIEATGLSKVYEMPGESLRVLAGVDLRVLAGETVAVVGPSGSGKTTLLNLLGALDHPTSGTITIGGRDIGGFSREEAAAFRNRSLGFIFQHHHLLPQCSVLENVLVPRLAGGWEEAPGETEERARSLLGEVGLQDRLGHFPYQISGGERLRTAVARALVNRPGLVLADEPTGSLDAGTTGRIADLLVEMNRKTGVTLVVVTHNAGLAERMDSYYELRNGKLERKER